MKKFWITFGQTHAHEIDNEIRLDKDTVLQIRAESYEAARDRAFELFGDQWAFLYDEERPPRMQYFPKGVIEL